MPMMHDRQALVDDFRGRSKPMIEAAREGEREYRKVRYTIEVELEVAPLVGDEDGGFPTPSEAILRGVLKAINPYMFLSPSALRLGTQVLETR